MNQSPQVRDRVKELRRVRASELLANPKNPRVHPESQKRAVEGILREVGISGALLARETPDGKLELIDGHLRHDVDESLEWPVLVLDLTEEEADKLLLLYDPLSAMAETDASRLADLLSSVKTDDAALESLKRDMQQLLPEDSPVGEGGEGLREVAIHRPPVMTWVLLGIPTVQFGKIAERIETLATDCTFCEMTYNDG